MTDLQDQCIYCSWLDGKVYKVSPDCPVHSRDERKPGPPTSGEVGWYECEVEGMHGVHVLHWRYGSFYIEHFSDNDLHLNTRPALRAVTPLHDYPLRRSDKERSDEGPSMSANPLVPGDALREAEQTVRKLQAELDDLRKVHQDLVAAYERLVNDDTDERNAFEQGREYRFTGRGEEHGIEWEYETYDDWKAAEGGER